MRATSLQDLIYKRGQSGITKASVTLVFNNTNPSQSPIGYADQPQLTVTRQIAVGGKNKYLVNGHNAPNKVVENLFQSVQLNVNNPHFLIMQGQITKVLNMKPPEILAMIEETAGTRMFEDRRMKALQTIDRKEKKVEEIAGLLTEVIEPRLATLRDERTQFMEYKRGEADIDRLRKTLVAFDFATRNEELQGVRGQQAELEASVDAFCQEEAALRDELAAAEDELVAVRRAREAETADGAQLAALEATAREAANRQTRLATQLELQETQLATAHRDADKLMRLGRRETQAETELQTKLAGLAERLAVFRAEYETVAGQVRETEELVQSLETGVAVSEDGSGETGYARLLRTVRDRLSECSLAGQRTQLRLAAIGEELAVLQTETATATDAIRAMQTRLAELQEEIAQQQQSETRRAQDTPPQHELERAANEQRAIIDRTQARVASLAFRYTDPSPHFDRGQVRGLVAELVQLEPAVAALYGAALEVAAGGRLYNVVVDNDRVAGELLERGRLARRVTLIPLNRIVGREIAGERVRRAEQLAPGRVRPALALVQSAREVAPAMRHVFGGTLVCDDAAAATAAAFDPAVATRTVTVEGDVYEPSGTLTGGSRGAGSALLVTLAQHRAAVARLAEIDAQRGALAAREAARTQLALLEHEETMLRRQLEQSAPGRLLARVERLTAERAALLRDEAARADEQQRLQEEVARVEREAMDFAANRDGKLRGLRDALERTRASFARETERLARAEREVQGTEAELVALQGQHARTEQQLLETREQCRADQTGIEALAAELAQCAEEAARLAEQMDAERQHMLRFDAQITLLETRRRAGGEKREQLALLLAKLRGDADRLREDAARWEKQLADTLKQHPWIEDSFR